MRTLLNKLISKIKGQKYEIDPEIPISYLLRLSLSRMMMILRGLLLFCEKEGLIFIAANVIVRCKNKFKVKKGVSINRGCYIDAVSKNGIKFGNNVSLGKYTTIECTGSLLFLGEGLEVGDNVGLGSHGFFGCAGGVKIGNDTIFGNYVSLHSENHNYSELDALIRLQGVTRKGINIGSNCWIGAKVTILDGANIGNGCIIAAGSVVTQGEYEDNQIYGGIPAKQIKKRVNNF